MQYYGELVEPKKTLTQVYEEEITKGASIHMFAHPPQRPVPPLRISLMAWPEHTARRFGVTGAGEFPYETSQVTDEEGIPGQESITVNRFSGITRSLAAEKEFKFP